MASGACVLRYEGARGVIWSVKFRDADGRQVRERLGRDQDGWNRNGPNGSSGSVSTASSGSGGGSRPANRLSRSSTST